MVILPLIDIRRLRNVFSNERIDRGEWEVMIKVPIHPLRKLREGLEGGVVFTSWLEGDVYNAPFLGVVTTRDKTQGSTHIYLIDLNRCVVIGEPIGSVYNALRVYIGSSEYNKVNGVIYEVLPLGVGDHPGRRYIYTYLDSWEFKGCFTKGEPYKNYIHKLVTAIGFASRLEHCILDSFYGWDTYRFPEGEVITEMVRRIKEQVHQMVKEYPHDTSTLM